MLRGERFRRRSEAAVPAATGAAGWRPTGSRPSGRGSAGTTLAARRMTTGTARSTTAGFELGRHGDLLIQLRNRNHNQTFLALARGHHFAFFAAFENTLQGVELEARFGFVATVAFDAGCFQQGDRKSVV